MLSLVPCLHDDNTCPPPPEIFVCFESRSDFHCTTISYLRVFQTIILR